VIEKWQNIGTREINRPTSVDGLMIEGIDIEPTADEF